MTRTKYMPMLFLLCCVLGAGCGGEGDVVEAPLMAAPESPQASDAVPEIPPEEGGGFGIPVQIPEEYLEKAQEFYRKALESGEKVPTGVKQWVQRDISSIGGWEYRIVDLAETDPEKLSEELNALGEERWECFWVEPVLEGKRFYFKKSKRSYLHNASGLARFVPIPIGGGGGGE